jgi:hypothetical protein
MRRRQLVKWSRLIAKGALASAVLLVPIIVLAAKEFVMPKPRLAATYPAHDEHSKESITVALDPYDMADKASIFSVNYREIGFMPIFVVVANDSDQPLELAGMKAELVTANRIKLSPAVEDDIERRLSRPSPNDRHYPVPIPFPTKKVKGAVSKQAREEIERAIFGAKAVEPHGTQVGFLFFDVSGISVPLAGAHFYLTGVRDAKGSELMFFEIPLENYLSAPTAR